MKITKFGSFWDQAFDMKFIGPWQVMRVTLAIIPSQNQLR